MKRHEEENARYAKLLKDVIDNRDPRKEQDYTGIMITLESIVVGTLLFLARCRNDKKQTGMTDYQYASALFHEGLASRFDERLAEAENKNRT